MRQPMLAATVTDYSQVHFPCYASYKIDGIRAIIRDGIAFSRSMKPIRNRFVQRWVQESGNLDGLDGELIVPGTFQDVTSAIMSEFGNPDFCYCVFDYWIGGSSPYNTRRPIWIPNDRVVVLAQFIVNSREELTNLLDTALEAGYEGLIVRSIYAPYKQGRSTLREQYLMKIKPFEDDEATIIGFEEQKENTNEQTTDERGYAKRSSAGEGKVGKNTLGKFIVHHPAWGELKIGCGQGLTQTLRQAIWDDQQSYLGKVIKFKYLLIGTKDKPRHPIFMGFRHPEDL